jgi:hypothetical protein
MAATGRPFLRSDAAPAAFLESCRGYRMSGLPTALADGRAHVPAPAKTSTNPMKIAASIVDKVQGVRMWITPHSNQNYPKA